MLDKLRKLAFELEGAILIVLIGIQFVAVPATYALCLAAATDWTWYNLIPRVVVCVRLCRLGRVLAPAELSGGLGRAVPSSCAGGIFCQNVQRN